jgi:trans-aconitate methyltransferase
MELSDLKDWVERGDLSALQSYFQYVQIGEEDLPAELDYVFQKVYLHACLKGKNEIANWMKTTVLASLPPIQQIAIRQSISYGNYLLKTHKRRHGV